MPMLLQTVVITIIVISDFMHHYNAAAYTISKISRLSPRLSPSSSPRVSSLQHHLTHAPIFPNYKPSIIIHSRNTICLRTRCHESSTACYFSSRGVTNDVGDATKTYDINNIDGDGDEDHSNVDQLNNNTPSYNNNKDQLDKTTAREIRKKRLHYYLSELGVDSDDISDAVIRSVTTNDGFDNRYGKSAIKAYRSYIDPKPSKLKAVERENVEVSANRYARQIDFLAKRHRSSEAEYVRHIDTSESRRTFPLVLVLDNLRSAANVGSIIRSADACGCLEIITTGITPHHNGNGADKLAKCALGAERIVSTRHYATTKQALEYLRQDRPNFKLYGMETTDKSKCYTSVQYPGGESVVSKNDDDEVNKINTSGVALFLGNEVSGVDTDIIPLLDEMIEIPMFGKKNSLNVAACAPVVMYEVLRQWGVR